MKRTHLRWLPGGSSVQRSQPNFGSGMVTEENLFTMGSVEGLEREQ